MAPSDPELHGMGASGCLASEPLVVPGNLASLMQGSTQCKMDMRDGGQTKVVCTIGPASSDFDMLKQLIHAGMTCARFDFTLGDKSHHQHALDNLRTAIKDVKKMVAIMLDTHGPTAIVPLPEGHSVALHAGQTVTLVRDTGVTATSDTLPVDDNGLLSAVEPGDRLVVGKYLTSGTESASALLEAKQVGEGKVICKCCDDGVLDGRVTLVIANLSHSAFPTLGPYDFEELRKWDEPDLVDFVSVSNTRSADDVAQLRDFLSKTKHMTETRIVAKLESLEGLKHFDEILEASDGIMLSRGDLGESIPVEKVQTVTIPGLFEPGRHTHRRLPVQVAHVQKCILWRCNLAAKPVIITRVVDTMQHWPRPTRAEATDVANAVLDGADCLLLGAETVRGVFPVETVRTVLSIAKEAEEAFNGLLHLKKMLKALPDPMPHSIAVAAAAVSAAYKINAALMVIFTATGGAPRSAAAFRPKMPILHVQLPTLQISKANLRWTPSGVHQARQSLITYGAQPILADPASVDIGRNALATAITYGKRIGLIRSGDRVVSVQKMSDTRTIAIVTVD